MLDTSIQIKTEHFDGPLGLLLLLIEKEEMDVRKLNLTKITAQYLDYLSRMQELNFDVAGEYLYLASTLILLKSNTCLSEEEARNIQAEFGGELNILSHADLVARLEELKRFQRLGEKLWQLPRQGEVIFTKPKVDRKTIVDSILTPIDLNELVKVMVDFIQREKRKYTIVRRDRLSIKEKLKFLKENLRLGTRHTFNELLQKNGNVENLDEGKQSIDNIVITFISLLELARLKKIEIFQNVDREDIYVDVTTDLTDLDVESANGFEPENADAGAVAPILH
jgi:segregation and condensation protein A